MSVGISTVFIGFLCLAALFVVAMGVGLAFFISLTSKRRRPDADFGTESDPARDPSANPYEAGQLHGPSASNRLPALIAVATVFIGLLVLFAIVFVLIVLGWWGIKVGRTKSPMLPPPVVVESEAAPGVTPVE